MATGQTIQLPKEFADSVSDAIKKGFENLNLSRGSVGGSEEEKTGSKGRLRSEDTDEIYIKEINRRTENLKKEKDRLENFFKQTGLSEAEEKKELIKLLYKEVEELEKKEGLTKGTVEYAENELEIAQKRVDILKAENELEKDKKRQRKEGWGQIKNGMTQIYKVGKELLDVWGKIDQAASQFSKSVGIGAQGMAAMRKNALNAVSAGGLGTNFNMSADELLALQEKYITQTGRRSSLSFDNQADAAAMNVLMGESGMELAIGLEKFGLSYTEAGKKAAQMFKEANKNGLSFQKYADNVQKGLAIAQNYTFKNGVKGMMEMAKKATEIRLDMQQVANFADKVGTVEGSVEVGSRLQVLGGPFAQFADPLAMLNESINNPTELLKRFERMTGSLSEFNGSEVTISAFNRMRLREAASAMGMDPSQVIESVLAQGRRKEVGRMIAGMGYDEDAMNLLKNAATLEDGKAKVTYVDDQGKSHTIEDLSKEQLTPEKLEWIRQSTNSQADNVRDIAIQLKGWDDTMKGAKKQYDNVKAQAVERSKIGEKAKSAVDWLASSDAKLGTILTFVKGIAIGGGVLEVGKGINNLTGGKLGSSILSSLKGFGSSRGIGGDAADFKTMKWFLNPDNRANGGIKQFFKSGIANLTSSGGLAATAAGVAIGEIAAGVGKKYRHELDEKRKSGEIVRGSKEDRSKNTLSKTLEFGGHSMAAGAVIGTALGGPLIGTLIGAAAGALAGGITAAVQNKDNKEALAQKRAFARQGLDFRGDYKKKELEEIQAAINRGGNGTITKSDFDALSEATRQKLLESGDVGLFESLKHLKSAEVAAENMNVQVNNLTIDGKTRKMAAGGPLEGPSHSNGGMPILGSDIEVEGGEFVVNKNAARRNMGILKAINGNGMHGLKVMPPSGGAVNTPSSLSVAPITININGSIKLEGANGKSADITSSIIDNPVFITQLTRMIEKQMNINTHGGLVVNKGLYY